VTAALLIFAAATIARLALNNVRVFSRADETAMLCLASQTTAPEYSYGRACERWLETPTAWHFPGVIRYGNIYLVGSLCRLFRVVSYRIPAAVSTAAGIASVALTWAIARRLAPGSETIAVALTASSPLQLHLGRRALQDETVCSLTLAGILAGITGHTVLAAFALAALLSVKETTLTAWPALLGCFWLAGLPLLPSAAVLCAAPVLFIAGFSAISRRPLLFPKFFRSVGAATADEYGRTQEGAPQRLPVDLLLLAPLVFMAAARSGLTPAVAFVALHLTAHSVVPIMRSVRMVTASEAMLRAVAAAVIAKWDPVTAACFVGLNLYCESMLFRRVFTGASGIYDPVTKNLTRALGMSPE
jgi:hypothetical protein